MPLKGSVKLAGMVPQLAFVHPIVQDVFRRVMGAAYECTVTSANDSKHGVNSLHFEGRALDYRTKDYVGHKLRLRDAVKEALGPDFDVVLEDLDGDNEHLHLEYDPK